MGGAEEREGAGCAAVLGEPAEEQGVSTQAAPCDDLPPEPGVLETAGNSFRFRRSTGQQEMTFGEQQGEARRPLPTMCCYGISMNSSRIVLGFNIEVFFR